MEPVIIVVGIILFIGFIVMISREAQKKEQARTDALRSKASQYNMTFDATDEYGLFSQFAHFKLFRRGSRKKLYNLFERGEVATFLTRVFDYKYTVSTGKSSTTYHQTVLAFESDDFNFPAFVMRPENFGDKIGNALGFKDIDFKENDVFSSAYFLAGKEEAAIRKLFSYDTLRHFSLNPGWTIEVNGKKVLLYKRSKRVEPNKIADFLESGLKAVSVLGVKEKSAF